ncbi:MAG TPA: hypothetical protein VF543_22030 [Pyrinomonadaceae bacterium]
MTPEVAQGMIENVVEQYVRPELRRRAAEDIGINESFWAAQVIFNSGLPVVRLNSEVRLQVKLSESEVWQDYVELRRNGPVRGAQVSLYPDEIGIRHITICHIGEGDEWKILFDAIGTQELIDDAPALGTVFRSPDASIPPLEKLRIRTEQLFNAVCNCLENDLIESAMILLYAGIDAMAWLNLPPSVDDVRGADFQQWVAAYFLPDSGFDCSPEDLYGARCGLVHSNTSESRLNRQGRASKIFYYREREGIKQGIIQILMDEQLAPWFINVDQFISALRTAIDRFVSDISSDTAKLQLVCERIQRFYFSRGIFLGRPIAK